MSNKVTYTTLSKKEEEEFFNSSIDESDDEAIRAGLLKICDSSDIDNLPAPPEKPIIMSPWANKNMTQEDYKQNMQNARVYKKLLKDHKRKQVLAIKRKHINEHTIPELYEPLIPAVLKRLIYDLTQDIRNNMLNQKIQLTTKLELYLKSRMPPIIKTGFARYPHTFNICPGFEYKTSEHFGGYKIFVQPNIPDFFEDYMTIINTELQHHVFQFDKNAERYYDYSKELIEQETKIAYKFAAYKHRLDFLENDVENYIKYLLLKDELCI